MKRKILIAAVLLICTAILAGCQCQHVWTAADCLTAKTCSECGATEGEPLAHTWADATCTAPKTCTACGTTEGEVLTHTWADATCADPKTCTVCGAAEGEPLDHSWDGNATYQTSDICTVCGAEGAPLTAYFEEHDLSVNVQTDVACDYVTCPPEKTDLETVGTFTASNYRVFASDKNHKAKEGYEWRGVDIKIVFSDGVAGDHGANVSCARADYYTGSELIQAGDKEVFAVNYLGTDYTDCVGTFENVHFDIEQNVALIFSVECYFQVPAGYDGVVLAFYHSGIDADGLLLHEVEDDNMLTFRLA